MDKRHERMLEEILKLPGNDRCADCHGPSPRWASVNLGIFLCVSCASIHRKLGTHRSRVKSVTLDDWSREHINSMRQIGNKASNAIWNPNESLHPPPHSVTGDERDSDMEKYIRRKYEQGAFKAGTRAAAANRPAPTSLNRARERDGRLPSSGSGDGSSSSSGITFTNRRNPELNDVLVKSKSALKERDLPALPHESKSVAFASGGTTAPPRTRPTPGVNANPASKQTSSFTTSAFDGPPPLVDFSGSSSSTLPLQLSGPATGTQMYGQNGQGMHAGYSASGSNGGMGQGSVPAGWLNGPPGGINGTFNSTMSGYSTGSSYGMPAQQQSQQVYPQSTFASSFGDHNHQYAVMHNQQQQQPQQMYQPSQMLGANMQMQAPAQQLGSSPYGQSPLAMGVQHGMMTGSAYPQQQQQQQYQQQQYPQQQQQQHQQQQQPWLLQQNMMIGMNGQYGNGMMR